ncbi:MAG: penicillin-binding protein 1C, partial [Armatimonadetes bacterium CG07_land_8_20_14_0_80_40_9]
MKEKAVITEAQFQRAEKEPIKLVKRELIFRASHFIDYLKLTIDKKYLDCANIIKTTIALTLQEEVEKIVSAHLSSLKKKGVTNAAVVVLDNKTGDILAMVGSEDFFNEENLGKNNGALAKRQPGSALKPFTYALSFENGYHPASIMPDIKTYFPTLDGDYLPRNYDLRYHGPVRIREALANSYNVSAVQMANLLGPNLILRFLKDCGFTTFDKPANYYGLGITLGNGEVTLLDITSAYSIFARGGKKIPLNSILSISYPNQGNKQKLLSLPEDKRQEQVISPQTAYLIADILSDRVARISAFGVNTPLNLPFKVAVKTGTSTNFRDNLTIGFTRYVTVGVWVGNFSGGPMHNICGITGAGPIFRDVMILAMKNYKDNKWLDKPDNIVQLEICPTSGMPKGPHCPGGISELFVDSNKPDKICSFHRLLLVDVRNGLLAGTECPAQFVQEKVFIDYPPKYQLWAESGGITLPPTKYSPLCRASPLVSQTQKEAKVEITFPDKGDTFALDPTIPDEYESVRLQANVTGEVKKVAWLVNGKKIATSKPPFAA